MAIREEVRNSHPCFGGALGKAGRIHLPVSPGCNIGCRFCSRVVGTSEVRPGVTAKVLTPQEALDVLQRALELAPEISVVGIAGPGEALATPYALETFRLVRAAYPSLIRCMSTNGLLLDEQAGQIAEAGVNTLSVTVNAVSPAILSQLNAFVLYRGQRFSGEEGAALLIAHQLAGIRLIHEAGITVKVNTVLVPGINDRHIEAVASAVKGAGADIYNIIPLIPQAELAHIPEPECADIRRARREAGKYIEIFRHCQRCRADAASLLTKDIGGLLYEQTLAGMENFSHG